MVMFKVNGRKIAVILAGRVQAVPRLCVLQYEVSVTDYSDSVNAGMAKQIEDCAQNREACHFFLINRNTNIL
jgi:hypothetical protein